MTTNPEQLARDSLPPGVFDSLLQSVKDAMIAAHTRAETEKARAETEKARAETEKARADEEQRRADELQAARDEEDRIKAEAEQEKKEYDEQIARGYAISREQMRKSGIVERIGQSLEQTKKNRLTRIEAGHIEISSEFPSNEPDPVSLVGGLIHGFRRQTIEALAPQIQEIRARARSFSNVQRSASAYMMFYLWTGNQHRVATKAIGLSDHDFAGDITHLYEALERLIADIERVKEGYEFIFNGEERTHAHFYFRANYYQQPQSV